ncbi:tRNA pseudouridine(38/39) synthase isoform X2 [Condylostylus longicornis]|uniref:tRNA pseudouridine(38/39) synthase isoform X2 n=1 Tax=Condylostylus longicornis TaxID=2530218 RepID=UPI00244DF27A|nr:tRNA pseudouridine(38/39) synthase isoform X2 [Condylostylus longicornis]
MEEKKFYQVNKKVKMLEDDLNKLSKCELIEKIVQLRAHNSQLKNIIEKTNQTKFLNEKNNRKFDFNKSYKRHVLLKFLYFGWDYQGFASQEDTTATIEFHLFRALIKTCLIENRETSNYNRCGRTDKEVSAFCQGWSKFPEEEQMTKESLEHEIDYCNMLNRVLPNNIKCISWMPLKNKHFSARFDCYERTYKYFFPKGDLDIERMRSGCKFLVGVHDFRNLCKMDVGNGVVNFVRSIKYADIHACQSEHKKDTGYSMYYLKITGKAFLWHQIRCIMSILMLIGEKNEDPSVISELLDIEKNPCKPQYGVASGIPLNLYNCEFDVNGLNKKINENTIVSDSSEKSLINESSDTEELSTAQWIYNKENLTRLIQTIQSEWSIVSIKATMINEMLQDLESAYKRNFGSEAINFQAKNLQQGVKQKQYQKIMNRKRCESLENRVEHYVKKQRLITTENKTNSIE